MCLPRGTRIVACRVAVDGAAGSIFSGANRTDRRSVGQGPPYGAIRTALPAGAAMTANALPAIRPDPQDAGIRILMPPPRPHRVGLGHRREVAVRVSPRIRFDDRSGGPRPTRWRHTHRASCGSNHGRECLACDSRKHQNAASVPKPLPRPHRVGLGPPPRSRAVHVSPRIRFDDCSGGPRPTLYAANVLRPRHARLRTAPRATPTIRP